MLTLYDYLRSQNAWKVRQLLHHLDRTYRTQTVSLFEGEGQQPDYLAINPWGAVPAIKLDDGRVLAESNAILWFLSEATPYRPTESFAAAKVMQWLSFEACYIEPGVGSLRYWTLTGKLAARPAALVASKRLMANRALQILDRKLAMRPYIAGENYSIADISLFAYAHRAEEAGLPTEALPHLRAWVDRVRSHPTFLTRMYPYDLDPHACRELP